MKYLVKQFFILILWLGSTSFLYAQKNKVMNLVAGTFYEDGLQLFEFNTETGDVQFRNKLETPGAIFIVESKDYKHLYTVSQENNEGFVNAYEFDPKSGSLKFLNKVKSKGSSPSTITLNESETFAFVSHFVSGNVSVFPVQKDGTIGEACQVIQHTGVGVHPQRQDRARAHSTVFTPDQKYLMVGDLGLDKIMMYKLDASNKTTPLTPATTPYVNEKPGGGTRMVVVHPNKKFIYSIQEITADVSAYSYKDGILTPLQTLTMVAPETGDVGSAADIKISPDGKFLYASNRGDVNELVVYAINAKTGMLEYKSRQSTLGRTPRYFAIDPTGNYLLVSNMGSAGGRRGAPPAAMPGQPSVTPVPVPQRLTSTIVIFKRDKNTGLLADTGKKIDIIQPGFLMFLPLPK